MGLVKGAERRWRLSLFVDEYSKSLDLKKSLAVAGLEGEGETVLEDEAVCEALERKFQLRQVQTDVDTAWLLEELRVNVEKGRERGQIKASTDAIIAMAKLTGLMDKEGGGRPSVNNGTVLVFGPAGNPSMEGPAELFGAPKGLPGRFDVAGEVGAPLREDEDS